MPPGVYRAGVSHREVAVRRESMPQAEKDWKPAVFERLKDGGDDGARTRSGSFHGVAPPAKLLILMIGGFCDGVCWQAVFAGV